jgi:hypothetical protein
VPAYWASRTTRKRREEVGGEGRGRREEGRGAWTNRKRYREILSSLLPYLNKNNFPCGVKPFSFVETNYFSWSTEAVCFGNWEYANDSFVGVPVFFCVSSPRSSLVPPCCPSPVPPPLFFVENRSRMFRKLGIRQ